jgi:hypothetical protein
MGEGVTLELKRPDLQGVYTRPDRSVAPFLGLDGSATLDRSLRLTRAVEVFYGRRTMFDNVEYRSQALTLREPAERPAALLPWAERRS